MDIRRAEVEAILDSAEEQVDDRLELMSPSGRYRLLIRAYHRPPHRNYTRGTVIRIADGVEVCDIKRNYYVFHHSFVTKGPDEYLIAGHSYMSQVVVDLERAMVHEPPGDHYDPTAFCWARASLSPDGNTLVVDGCIWACPYEYRFFDFTDPATGWPRVPVANGDVIDVDDGKPPAWIDASTFECYQTRTAPDGAIELAVRTRLARDGSTMAILERWLGDAERARRAAEAERVAAIDAWWQEFSTGDPMYLAMQAAIRAHALPDDGGIPAEQRIVKFFRRASPRASADLIWDVGVRVAIMTYDRDGRSLAEWEFPHTVDGITAALAAIGQVFAT